MNKSPGDKTLNKPSDGSSDRLSGKSSGKSSGNRARTPEADPQRDALESSEKAAARDQPGSYKERENEEKVVEIGGDKTDAPIKGLDPDT